MDIQKILFGEKSEVNLYVRQRDFDYVHKELLKQALQLNLFGKNMSWNAS